MRYALGHRSSPFHPFGAICGVPSASRMIFIDTCPQPFHQMTSSLSPVSSRDLTIIWGHLEGRRGASAGINVRNFIASERSTAFQTRFVSCLLISAISRFIR